MAVLLNTPASQARSFRVAWWLFLGGACLATFYLIAPHASAQYVVAVFFVIHAIVCLWAAQEAFAGSGPASGCVPGVVLWIALSLEFMLLSAVWLQAVGGPY
jgi:hypothetical protein